MKYLKNISEKYWVLGDQVVVSGAAFLTNMILARALGLEQYGKFAAIVMVQLFVLSINMAFSSQVYQVTYPSLNNQDKQNLTCGMFGLQSIMVLIVLFIAFIGHLIYQIDLNTVVMAGLSTILYLLQDFLRRAFITQTNSKYAFLIDCLTNLLQTAVLLVAFYFHRLDQLMAWSIIGLSFIPSVITGIVLLKPGCPNFDKLNYAWQLQTKKGAWLMGSSLLQWGSGYFFILASGWWLGSAALGALRLAQYIFGLLNLLLQAIENYVLPRAVAVTGMITQNWWPLLRKCLMMIVPFLCLFCFFAEDLFRLAGNTSAHSYTFVVYGLSMVYLLITIGYPVRIAIRSLELNKDYFIGYISSVTMSLVLAPWLIKGWGLYGVLAGIFITQLIMITYWLIILQRKYSILWKSYI